MAVLITTSRKPCNRTRSFCRDLATRLPHAIYQNRGKANLDDIIVLARALFCDTILVVQEMHGNPSKIEFISVHADSWQRQGYMLVQKAILSRELNSPRLSKAVDISIDAPSSVQSWLKFFVPNEEDIVPDSDLLMRVDESKKEISFYYKSSKVGPVIVYREVRLDV